MFSFYLGHFSLNAIYDKDVDRNNPRKDLFNSWVEQLGIGKKWIWCMIFIFWSFSFLGSIIHSMIYNKSLQFLVPIAIILAIVYSVPPLQLKGKAPWDLVIDLLSFGVLGPFFAIECILIIPPWQLVIPIILFSISTIAIVVLPTVMMDTTVDREHCYNTFSVKYGLENTMNVIKFFFIVQVSALAGFGILALLRANFLLLIIILLFPFGELNILGDLFFSDFVSEESAEVVVKRLMRSSLVFGIEIIAAVHFLNWLGLDFNQFFQEILSLL